MRNRGIIEFREKQYQTSWWVWVLLIGIDVLFIIGSILQLGFGKAFGNNPMSNIMLISLTILIILFSIFFLSSNLQTYINEEGIYIKYFPFHFKFKHFAWENIEKVRVRGYNPIVEYGGWGIKTARFNLLSFQFSKKGKIAYSVSGRNGLEILMKDGRKIMIGTRSPNSMEETLGKLAKKGLVND